MNFPIGLGDAGRTVPTHQFQIDNNKAKIVFIAPRYLGTQVVRPYLLTVGPDLLQNIGNAPNAMHTMGSGPLHSQEMINAVLPDANGGIEFNGSMLSDQWTFVMMIDIAISTGTRRFIVSGFIQDEPINQFTLGTHGVNPTVNPNAMLLITHCLNVNVCATLGSNGVCTSSDNVKVRDVYDFTPRVLSSISTNPGEKLYFTDPATCSEAAIRDSQGDVVISVGDSMVDNAQVNYLPSRLRSPRNILREVGAAIDSAAGITESVAEIGKPSRYNASYDANLDDMSNFLMNVSQQLKSQRSGMVGTPFQMSTPVSMNKIIRTFPNLDIKCIKGNSGAIVDERPQTIICPENVFAYMIGQVIQSTALDFNIGEIAFRYSSFNPNAVGVMQSGVLEVNRAVPMIAMTDEAMRANLHMFFKVLENDLWPIIKHSSQQGDFNVILRHDINGETFIGLHFYDRPEIDGWYTTNNVFGGMFMPNLGTLDVQLTNAQQLMSMERGAAVSLCPGVEAMDFPGFDDEMVGRYTIESPKYTNPSFGSPNAPVQQLY